MINLGNVVADSTIRIPFNSFDAAGASDTISNFTVDDVKIYKDGSTTDRGNTGGYTVTTNLDGNGIHAVNIDLSNTAVTDYYETGSTYDVAVNDVTVDGETVRFWAGRFAIENTKVGSRIKKIHRGTIVIPANAQIATATLSPSVNVDNCELFDIGSTSGTGASDGSAALTLSSTQVTAKRGGAPAVGMEVGWQVTEWEPF